MSPLKWWAGRSDLASVDWLNNWDDLVHGTAVFGAAVPLLIGGLLAWKLPVRLWWLGVAAGLVGSFFWFFGFPRIPPRSSEDVALTALALGVFILTLNMRLHWPVCLAACFILFTGFALCVYPAWLANTGALLQKLLICGALAASVTIAMGLAEAAGQGWGRNRWRAPLSVFIPPAIVLAILLTLGGAARFGQAAGALAAALGGVCLVLVLRNPKAHPSSVAALWGILFTLFAWSGWLFAEIRYGLAATLFLAPLLGLLAHALPLPRHRGVFEQLWGGLASAAVSGIVAWIALSEYFAEMSEFEGY